MSRGYSVFRETSLWERVWDSNLEEYAEAIHYDAKYRFSKRVIVFWYCISRFGGWENCYNNCDEDPLPKEWDEKIKVANMKIQEDIQHWIYLMKKILSDCKDQIVPEGALTIFVSEVFRKEHKDVCEPVFLYLLYLCLYTEKPEAAAQEAISLKKIRRDTIAGISAFRKQFPTIDSSSLFSIYREIYQIK